MEERQNALKELIDNDNDNINKFTDKYTQIEFESIPRIGESLCLKNLGVFEFDSEFYSDYDELDETQKHKLEEIIFDSALEYEFYNRCCIIIDGDTWDCCERGCRTICLLAEKIKHLNEMASGAPVFK